MSLWLRVTLTYVKWVRFQFRVSLLCKKKTLTKLVQKKNREREETIPSPLSLSGLAPLGIKDWNVHVLIMEYDWNWNQILM
jgi:hypothetical protein